MIIDREYKNVNLTELLLCYNQQSADHSISNQSVLMTFSILKESDEHITADLSWTGEWVEPDTREVPVITSQP